MSRTKELKEKLAEARQLLEDVRSEIMDIEEKEKDDRKVELIDGAYYKCYYKNTKDKAAVRQYVAKTDCMYDGDVFCAPPNDYVRIEPLEHKKYGLCVATDEDCTQWLYKTKPERGTGWWNVCSGGKLLLDAKIFPDQTWEDEPREI
jgi:hypothetical protein